MICSLNYAMSMPPSRAVSRAQQMQVWGESFKKVQLTDNAIFAVSALVNAITLGRFDEKVPFFCPPPGRNTIRKALRPSKNTGGSPHLSWGHLRMWKDHLHNYYCGGPSILFSVDG